MGQLTTHVLDTTAGLPAVGVRIDLHDLSAGVATRVAEVTTGRDGRCPAPLLSGPAFRSGRYSLTFQVGGYFRGRGLILPEPAFIEEAIIHIGIAHAAEHYHVPLLISPWSYSVYRGG
jgi:5-hydroxyisourate hydrolase